MRASMMLRRATVPARPSGVSAVNITLGYVSGPMEPFEYTVGSIGAWDKLLRERADAGRAVVVSSHSLTKAERPADRPFTGARRGRRRPRRAVPGVGQMYMPPLTPMIWPVL